jgi:hypothetical protein
VCRTLEAAGHAWNEMSMEFDLNYPPGLVSPPLWPGANVPQVSGDEYWLDDPNTKASQPPHKRKAKLKVVL